MCIKNIENKIKERLTREERMYNSKIIDCLMRIFKDELKSSYIPLKSYVLCNKANDKINKKFKVLEKEVKGYRQLYKAIKFGNEK